MNEDKLPALHWDPERKLWTREEPPPKPLTAAQKAKIDGDEAAQAILEALRAAGHRHQPARYPEQQKTCGYCHKALHAGEGKVFHWECLEKRLEARKQDPWPVPLLYDRSFDTLAGGPGRSTVRRRWTFKIDLEAVIEAYELTPVG